MRRKAAIDGSSPSGRTAALIITTGTSARSFSGAQHAGRPRARRHPASSRPSAPGRGAPAPAAPASPGRAGPRGRRTPRRAGLPARTARSAGSSSTTSTVFTTRQRASRTSAGAALPVSSPVAAASGSADRDPLLADDELADRRVGGHLPGLEDRDQPVERRAQLDLAQQDAVVHRRRGGRDRDGELVVDVGVDLGGDERGRAPRPQLVGERRGVGRHALRRRR